MVHHSKFRKNHLTDYCYRLKVQKGKLSGSLMSEQFYLFFERQGRFIVCPHVAVLKIITCKGKEKNEKFIILMI